MPMANVAEPGVAFAHSLSSGRESLGAIHSFFLPHDQFFTLGVGVQKRRLGGRKTCPPFVETCASPVLCACWDGFGALCTCQLTCHPFIQSILRASCFNCTPYTSSGSPSLLLQQMITRSVAPHECSSLYSRQPMEPPYYIELGSTGAVT